MKTSLKFLTVGLVLILSSFQLIKTQLALTVRNELGNTEDNVKVQLFEKEEDYLKEANAVAEGVTDAKGIVKFKELKSMPYYVLARKGDKDNSGGGEQIGKLEANRINKATVVIQ